MMSNDPNLLPVPYEGPAEKPKPPTSGSLLDEVRVRSPLEIRRGRNLLIWVYLFLMVLALAFPAIDLALGERSQLPLHVTRLLVTLVLIACLLRALPKIRFFAAIILGAGAAVFLALFVWGLMTHNLLLLIPSAISVVVYGIMCPVLAISPGIRGYFGYRRAEKRHKRETKERKDLQRIVAYQAEKARGRRP